MNEPNDAFNVFKKRFSCPNHHLFQQQCKYRNNARLDVVEERNERPSRWQRFQWQTL